MTYIQAPASSGSITKVIITVKKNDKIEVEEAAVDKVSYNS